MAYDQRYDKARTGTTRHLDSDEAGDYKNGMQEYFEGARGRTQRFAQKTAYLREVQTEIDTLGREAHDRPTGVLSGGDIDIAYHYLGIGLGLIATLYSIVGAIFALNGGGEQLIGAISQRWSAGPAAALSEALFSIRTLAALGLQALLFIIMVGTRRNPNTWQHWASMIASAALTYAGWSSLWLAYGAAPVAAITATIPAALIGGALTWLMIKATSTELPRRAMIGIIVAGVVAGALGTASLIHWSGALLAWGADQIARRFMVIG
ncbi:MAG: hypothetical protein RLZZ387_317 [Chloroflexota bacterium]|jgi:hypothetical protein